MTSITSATPVHIPLPSKPAISDSEAIAALDVLEHRNGQDLGLYRHILGMPVSVKPQQALARLDQAKPVYLGEQALSSRTELAVLDQLEGRKQTGPLADDQAQALRNQPDPFATFQALSSGQTLSVHEHQAKSLNDLSELNALYGNGAHTDVTDSQLRALKFFDKQFVCSDAYQTLHSMRNDGSAVVGLGQGKSVIVDSLPQLEELNALQGDKQNTILPQAQFDALQSLSDSPYEALQQLKNGRPIEYRFQGGNYGEELTVPIASLADLPAAQALVANTRERDRYRLPAEEYTQRLQELETQARSLTEKAAKAAEELQQRGDAMPARVQERYSEMETRGTTRYGFNYRTHRYDSAYGLKRVPVEHERTVSNQARTQTLQEAQAELAAARAAAQSQPKLDSPQLKQDLANWAKSAQAAGSPALAQAAHRMQALVEQQQSRPERPAGWQPTQPNLSGETPLSDRPEPAPVDPILLCPF